MLAKTHTSSAVKKRYNQKTYDRVEIVVPKGDREIIQQAAEAVNESVNQFVGKAVLDRMGLEEWPHKSTVQNEERGNPDER